MAVKSIAAHAKGPQAIQPDGHVAYTGVRGMRLVETRDSASGAVTGRVLLSGGWKGVEWGIRVQRGERMNVGAALVVGISVKLAHEEMLG